MLKRYILDNPTITKGKRVLDFGCGSGALSIAALKSGAKSCVANDVDERKYRKAWQQIYFTS